MLTLIGAAGSIRRAAEHKAEARRCSSTRPYPTRRTACEPSSPYGRLVVILGRLLPGPSRFRLLLLLEPFHHEKGSTSTKLELTAAPTYPTVTHPTFERMYCITLWDRCPHCAAELANEEKKRLSLKLTRCTHPSGIRTCSSHKFHNG